MFGTSCSVQLSCTRSAATPIAHYPFSPGPNSRLDHLPPRAAWRPEAGRSLISLKPLIRLLPPVSEEMNVSMVLGDEKQRIFWLGESRGRTNKQGRRIKAADRAVIAIFDYGADNG